MFLVELLLISVCSVSSSDLSWTYGDAKMPRPHAYGAFATVNEKLYVIGGKTSGWTDDTSIYIYDMNTPSVWSTITTPISTSGYYCPHTCAVSASNSSLIYIVNEDYGSIEVFDTSTLQFVTTEMDINPMPYATRAGASCIDPTTNKIYVIGGLLSTPEDIPVKYVQIYDIQNNIWSTDSQGIESYPFGISYSPCSYHDGYIYHFGGAIDKREPDVYTDQIYRYDIGNNHWEFVSNYTNGPIAYQRVMVSPDNRHIYSVGGYDESKYYNGVDKLDTHTLNISFDGYLYPNQSIDDGVDGNYVTLMNDRFIVFGGKSNVYYDTMLISDIIRVPTTTSSTSTSTTGMSENVTSPIALMTSSNSDSKPKSGQDNGDDVFDIILVIIAVLLFLIVILLLYIVWRLRKSKAEKSDEGDQSNHGGQNIAPRSVNMVNMEAITSLSNNEENDNTQHEESMEDMYTTTPGYHGKITKGYD